MTINLPAFHQQPTTNSPAKNHVQPLVSISAQAREILKPGLNQSHNNSKNHRSRNAEHRYCAARMGRCVFVDVVDVSIGLPPTLAESKFHMSSGDAMFFSRQDWRNLSVDNHAMSVTTETATRISMLAQKGSQSLPSSSRFSVHLFTFWPNGDGE